MKAWLLWVTRFDTKPEPQILFDMIPASLNPLVVSQRELSEDEARLSVDVLAARYPAPPRAAS